MALLRPGGILVRATDSGVGSGVGSGKNLNMQAELLRALVALLRQGGASCALLCPSDDMQCILCTIYASCRAAHVL